MSIKTKAQLATELTTVITTGGLLTASEDRSVRQNSYDSLAALLGNNAFVGDQTITGKVGIGVAPTYNLDILTSSNNDRGISASNLGAGTNSYAGYFSSITGAATNKIGIYSTASGGTNNYSGIFDAGKVGIGTSVPTSKLHIISDGTASNYAQKIEALGGAEIAYFRDDKLITFGSQFSWNPISSSGGGLFVSKNLSIGNNAQSLTNSTALNITSNQTSSGGFIGLLVQQTNISTANSGGHHGFYVTMENAQTGTAVPDTIGGYIKTIAASTKNFASDKFKSLVLELSSTGQSGTISDSAMLQLETTSWSTVKPTTHRGIYIKNQGQSGIADSHGLYISAQSGSGINYGIYSATNYNIFGANGVNVSAIVAISPSSGAIPSLHLESGSAPSSVSFGNVWTETINQRYMLNRGGLSSEIISASAVNSVSPTSPDRTLTIRHNGTTYYLHAKTTND